MPIVVPSMRRTSPKLGPRRGTRRGHRHPVHTESVRTSDRASPPAGAGDERLANRSRRTRTRAAGVTTTRSRSSRGSRVIERLASSPWSIRISGAGRPAVEDALADHLLLDVPHVAVADRQGSVLPRRRRQIKGEHVDIGRLRPMIIEVQSRRTCRARRSASVVGGDPARSSPDPRRPRRCRRPRRLPPPSPACPPERARQSAIVGHHTVGMARADDVRHRSDRPGPGHAATSASSNVTCSPPYRPDSATPSSTCSAHFTVRRVRRSRTPFVRTPFRCRACTSRRRGRRRIG